MKSPKPTGLQVDSPPKIHVPDRPDIPEPEPEDHFIEIKNPLMAKIFYYLGLTAILFLTFMVCFLIIFGRFSGAWNRLISPWFLMIPISGGLFGAYKIYQLGNNRD